MITTAEWLDALLLRLVNAEPDAISMSSAAGKRDYAPRKCAVWVCASRVRRIALVSKGAMAESAREFRCWVCSVSFDVEGKYLRHLTTMKHADMEDILNRTDGMELEMHNALTCRTDLEGVEHQFLTDIFPLLPSAPVGSVTMDEECIENDDSLVTEVSHLESYEESEMHDPGAVASSNSRSRPGTDEEDEPEEDS